MQEILLTEDDETIALGLEYSLSQSGFSVTVCPNATSTFHMLRERTFDLALLDLTLPDGNGYEICRRIRAGADTGPNSRQLPVIFLTACEEEVNIIMGLDMGADDYVTKPFRIGELISRIRSVLRRSRPEDEALFSVGQVTVDIRHGKVFRGGQEVFLTALEYKLFLTMVHNRGQILSRSQLLEGIFDVAGDFVNDNTLSVYIKRLREKLEEDPQNPEVIKTVRGLGYKVGD